MPTEICAIDSMGRSIKTDAAPMQRLRIFEYMNLLHGKRSAPSREWLRLAERIQTAAIWISQRPAVVPVG
jgi:hypothetical protein